MLSFLISDEPTLKKPFFIFLCFLNQIVIMEDSETRLLDKK